MCQPGPNGMTLKAARAVKAERIGAGTELAGELGAQLDGGAVRAHRDRVAGFDAAPLGVVVGQLGLGGGTLELELGYALDGRAAEERAVTQQLEGAAAGRARRLDR